MEQAREPVQSPKRLPSSDRDAAKVARPLWFAIGAVALGALALFAAWLFVLRTPASWQIMVDVSRLDDEAFVYPNDCPNDPNSAGSAILVDDDPRVHAGHMSGIPFPLPPMTSSSVIVVRVLNQGGTTHFRALLTERHSGRRVVELSPTAIPSVAGLVYVAAVYANGQPAPLPPSCSFQVTPVTVIFDASHHTGSWPRFKQSASRDGSLGKASFLLMALVIMVALGTAQARRWLLGPDHRRSALQGPGALALALGVALTLWFVKGVIFAGTAGVVAMAGFSWVVHWLLAPGNEGVP